MAFNDVPLEDAGRNYYSRQFDHRVRAIRKYGTAPAYGPGSRGAGAGGAIAGGIVLLILIGIGVAIADSHNSSTYDVYEPPQIQFDPPPPLPDLSNLPDFNANHDPLVDLKPDQPGDLPNWVPPAADDPRQPADPDDGDKASDREP